MVLKLLKSRFREEIAASKERTKANKEIRAIERREEIKARKEQAVRVAQESAKIKANQRLKRLKSGGSASGWDFAGGLSRLGDMNHGGYKKKKKKSLDFDIF